MNETATNYNQPEQRTVDVGEFLKYLLSRALWIVLVVAIFVGGAFCYTQFFTKPYYQSTVTLYIIGEGGVNTSSDVQVNSSIAKDCKGMLQRRTAMEEVINNLGLGMSYEQLAAKTSFYYEDDSRIIDITITDTDPYIAKKIADEFAEVAKMIVKEQMKLDANPSPANLPKAPTGPSLFKNMLLAGIAGGALACLFFVLLYTLDDKIKNEDHIEKELGISVMGVIPYEESLNRTKGGAVQ